jgi:hypothetical protein
MYIWVVQQAQPFVAMAGIDFPKMENRKPEIYLSLQLIVKLVATDDKRRNGFFIKTYSINFCFHF